MGIVKVNIHDVYRPDTNGFYHIPNTGVELDPYYFKAYPNFLSEEECRTLAKVIQRDEEEILSIPNDTDKPYKGLTAQHEVYNWFNHKDVALLNIPQRLLELPEFNHWNSWIIQCWTNILRQGEGLLRHHHCNGEESLNTLYACNIFISGDPRTGTHYYDAGDTSYTPNEVGTLIIAGQLHEHEVKNNIDQTPRISMALDVITSPAGYMNNTKRFVYYRNDGVSEKPSYMQL